MNSLDVHVGADAEAQKDFGFSPLSFEEGIELGLGKIC